MILVTGATGYVGAPLVQLLQQRGVPVRAAARRPPADRAGVTGVALDLTDPATWPGAFDGVEAVFLVRPPQLGSVERDLLPALAAARDAGVRFVVFLSLQGVERLPFTPHARVERWLRASGLRWTFLRASFFLQNLTTTHLAPLRDGRIVVPAGDGRTAFVDTHDVAEVAAHALLHPEQAEGQAWTLTGPQALTYGEVAAVLTGVLGRPVRYTRPGPLAYVRHARRELGMAPPLVAVTLVIYTTARLGLAAGLSGDVERVLGRPPTGVAAWAERDRAALTG